MNAPKHRMTPADGRDALHTAHAELQELEVGVSALGDLLHDLGESLGNEDDGHVNLGAAHFIGLGCLLRTIGREGARLAERIDDCWLAWPADRDGVR